MHVKRRQQFFSVNGSKPDILYCSSSERMEEEADCDKACSESIAEDESVEDEEEAEILGQELEAQGSVKRKKAGRKSCWPEEFVEEVVNVVCESEYYRKKLLFTNCKATKNLEIYCRIVKEAKNRLSESNKIFDFTAVQTRTKFRSCIAICKKASMKRKCGSGITNYMDNSPAWLKKLFSFVESRDSCDPTLASEPSFAVLPESSPDEGNDSRVFSSKTPDQTKTLFVPIPKKRLKKDTATSLLKEAVTAFNNYASKDPATGIIDFLKEENEKSRQHELRMMEIQMNMFQTMMASFQFGNLQRGVIPQHATFTPRQGGCQPKSFENLDPQVNSWLSYMNSGDEI